MSKKRSSMANVFMTRWSRWKPSGWKPGRVHDQSEDNGGMPAAKPLDNVSNDLRKPKSCQSLQSYVSIETEWKVASKMGRQGSTLYFAVTKLMTNPAESAHHQHIISTSSAHHQHIISTKRCNVCNHATYKMH